MQSQNGLSPKQSWCWHPQKCKARHDLPQHSILALHMHMCLYFQRDGTWNRFFQSLTSLGCDSPALAATCDHGSGACAQKTLLGKMTGEWRSIYDYTLQETILSEAYAIGNWCHMKHLLWLEVLDTVDKACFTGHTPSPCWHALREGSGLCTLHAVYGKILRDWLSHFKMLTCSMPPCAIAFQVQQSSPCRNPVFAFIFKNKYGIYTPRIPTHAFWCLKFVCGFRISVCTVAMLDPTTNIAMFTMWTKNDEQHFIHMYINIFWTEKPEDKYIISMLLDIPFLRAQCCWKSSNIKMINSIAHACIAIRDAILFSIGRSSWIRHPIPICIMIPIIQSHASDIRSQF